MDLDTVGIILYCFFGHVLMLLLISFADSEYRISSFTHFQH